MAVRFRPFDPGFLQDPYPTYADLRERAPVQRVRIGPVAIARLLVRFAKMRREMGQPGIVRTLLAVRRKRARSEPTDPRMKLRRRLYVVSRYDDVNRVLRDPELFSSAAMGGPRRSNDDPNVDPTNGSLIGLDPPEHGRHRAIVNRGFTPRRIARLEPSIRKIADELLSAFEARGRCDLVSEFANPLPVAVIAELLGLDPARRDDFKRWSTALIIGSTQGGGPPRAQLFREFRGYMSEVVEQRRREPGDDLISLLVHAEEEDGVLDTGQVVGFASLLLAAGSETTTNLIGNALLALHEYPEQAEALRADPGLIPQLLEETLRFDPPVQLLMRLATRETRIADTPIPEGSVVVTLLGAANRDPARFERPERFDVQRSTQGHLAFGLGNHFCLGASLARLEARIALEMLFERLPDWRIDAARIERHGSFLIRGPRTLPLRFGVREAPAA
jgi:cytochrome P450